MSHPNPYLRECWEAMPRLLGTFDVDKTSLTFGCGDRRYWAWKLMDFGNGVLQGAAHGLARLVACGLLPQGMSERSVLRRIDSMFEATSRLLDSDGSLSEAFPRESSFCVTAQVACDLLCAAELLAGRIESQQRVRWLGVVRPMIGFLRENEESHGFISNHLAAAAAALLKWAALSSEKGEEDGKHLIAKIRAAQSEEGWFREYEGADPGYQSLCTHYLAIADTTRPDVGLEESLARSLRFLWHFAHPDGSFGGIYGSRNTRFYFPSGIEALAPRVPEAAALAAFMRHSIDSGTTVTLAAMDELNLVPMFNSYAWAACAQPSGSSPPMLPALRRETARTEFPNAGLLIDRGPSHYTVISLHKGGVCQHYLSGAPARIDAGVVAESPQGRLHSTQAFEPANEIEWHGDRIVVKARMVEMSRRLPRPLEFALLRLLAVTVLRFGPLRRLFKRMLVTMLITGKRKSLAVNRRTIRLGETLEISDQWESEAQGWRRVENPGVFSAIHMASQGYWQRQDDSV